MIAQETLSQIQHAPIVERIQVIEVILQSLKQDMQLTLSRKHPQKKRFTVRRFHLGQEVHCDRDELYAEEMHNVHRRTKRTANV